MIAALFSYGIVCIKRLIHRMGVKSRLNPINCVCGIRWEAKPCCVYGKKLFFVGVNGSASHLYSWTLSLINVSFWGILQVCSPFISSILICYLAFWLYFRWNHKRWNPEGEKAGLFRKINYTNGSFV